MYNKNHIHSLFKYLIKFPYIYLILGYIKNNQKLIIKNNTLLYLIYLTI